jgi:putative ABC transport system ATP-binding protein
MRALSVASPIVTTDLVVDYHSEAGTVRALECPALSVAGGTSVAIMGVSGSGKSTLLGLLAGLALPTEGTVTIGGETVSALTERERVSFRRVALGMVYQSDNLLPHLTVEENVALQLAICRDTPADRRGDPAALLERLGLTSLAQRLPHQLSGGERQRAAVARAVIHGPRVILADEPTGALDAASGRIVIELLVEVHHEIGATLVVVTHDPQIAGHLSRTIHLDSRAATVAASHAR